MNDTVATHQVHLLFPDAPSGLGVIRGIDFALGQTHQICHVVIGDSDFRLFGLLLVPEDVSP